MKDDGNKNREITRAKRTNVREEDSKNSSVKKELMYNQLEGLTRTRQFNFSLVSRATSAPIYTMISSRRKIYRASFILIFILMINVVSIDARRISSGRSSGRSGGGRSGGGRSGGRVSVPRTPVYMPRTPVYVPKPPVHTPPRQQTSNFPQPHTPHNSGSTSGKDSSNVLINAEGGGRPRPGSTGNDHKQQSTPHQPSAPYEPVNKVNVGHVQSQAPTQGSSSPSGGYPPWANPSASQHGGSNPHAPFPSAPHTSQQPHGSSFPSSPYNPSQPNQGKPGMGPLASAPYPPTHPAGPISHQPITPVHQTNQNNGAPHQMPMPHQNSYPYPNSPHGMPPPYSPPSAPYPGGHPPGMPMPSAPHIGFGNGAAHGGVHQPIGTPHNYQPVGSSPMQPHGGYSQPTVIHNHYNGPPVGSPQNPAGNPMYGHQPAYGGAPMGQPFVPGQTLVVLPNQQPQDSGRGLGQIFKEALVFSTVNAGVNRLINGPSHHHDSYPSGQPPATGAAASSSTVTNTVIYNNQYGNPTTGTNGTPLQGQTDQPTVIPGNPVTYPAGTSSGSSNVPAGTAGVPNTGIGSFNTGIGSSNTGIGSSNTGIGSPNPSTGTSDPGTAYPGTSSSTSGTQYPSGSQSTTNPVAHVGHTGIADRTSASSTNNTNNQTAPPVQEFQYFISNEELWNLTENLFAKDEMNASQYVTLNLQNRSVDPNATDQSPAPLLYVHNEAYALPTVQVVRDLFDNYEFDSEKKETMDSRKRGQENVFLDVFLNTDIMTTTMSWLSAKGYVEPDDFEWKDTIRHIWMTRVNGATSGFERIFLAEKYPGPSILGGQNWIYFDSQELLRRVNYMSYVDKVNLADKATLVKINFKIDDVVKPNTTMLIGTPPELEMALYTICYYARPNDLCTVSLGGTKLNLYTHGFRYFGKDVIDLGLMFF